MNSAHLAGALELWSSEEDKALELHGSMGRSPGEALTLWAPGSVEPEEVNKQQALRLHDRTCCQTEDTCPPRPAV
ncbi:hypothetical protein EYF80_059635 [Liparis tanakae]|uniref:Uncharacterized protein n=1 Tax=Liparis tanakae TaxID=230148 RepID=A0A4Z2EN31_9TELE|nr:hypothetical protein EYF80_059635 [Liparis tanakae]